MSKLDEKHHLVLFVLCLYILSSAPFLLNTNGLYWDDWVSYGHSPETIESLSFQLQAGIKGHFAKFLTSFGNSIYPFRLFVFFAYLFISFAFYAFLRSLNFNQTRCLTASAVFLLYPLPFAKVPISIIPFMFPLFLFSAAVYVSSFKMFYRSFCLRLVTIPLFLGSFSLGSILVFFYCWLLFVSLRPLGNDGLKLTKQTLLTFFILPIAYYLLKINLWQPTGLYEGYNSIEIQALILFPIKILSIGYDFTFGLFLGRNLFVFLCVIIAVIFIARFRGRAFSLSGSFGKWFLVTHYKLLACFLFLFVGAIFAYVAVGKTPVVSGWNSRFGILIPFSVAVLISGFVPLRSAFKTRVKCAVGCLLVLFGLKSFVGYHELAVEWKHMLVVGDYMRCNDSLGKSDTFIVKEYYEGADVSNSKNFYEWTGLYRAVSGKSDKLFVVGEPQIAIKSASELVSYKQYSFDEWLGKNRDEPSLIELTKSTVKKYGFSGISYGLLRLPQKLDSCDGNNEAAINIKFPQ